MNARTWIIITTALFACLCGGCGSNNHGPSADSPNVVIAATEARDNRAVRRAASFGQAGLLYARTVHVDPVIRPVSTFLSLASVVVKSTRGLLQRTAVRAVQSPALSSTPIPELAYSKGMDLHQWEQDLDRIAGHKSSKGTINYLVDGEQYFNRLTQAFADAEESIDIRTYIFDNDDFAVSVGTQLKERSTEVRVRVMVDGIGNILAQQSDSESTPADHEAPLSIANFLQSDSRVDVRTLTNPWFTGDHTKTTIVDGEIAFVGGMNIGREYRYDWHDLMLEVTGPVVDDLQFASDKTWARAGMFGDAANFLRFLQGKTHRADDTGYPIRILYTRKLDSQIYRAQLEAIRRAQSHIIIENPYFSDDVILYELARARRRGVDVRVILPSSGNHGPTNESNKISINHMLDNGIRVYLYPGMSHIKAAVYDGWACVGSANFDKLSLEINRELNLATSHAEAVNDLLEQVLLPDMERATELSEQIDVTIQTRLLEIAVDELL
jgi:cardiolipin synthase